MQVTMGPDVVVVDSKERSCTIIDIACPFDHQVSLEEQEIIK